MSTAQAARFYRLRWENEGLFRTYKRTLAKVRLVGRTRACGPPRGVRLVAGLPTAAGARGVGVEPQAVGDGGRRGPCSAQAILVVREN